MVSSRESLSNPHLHPHGERRIPLKSLAGREVLTSLR